MEYQGELKTCRKDPRHTWVTDINYCPYCNHTADERAKYLQNELSKKESRNDANFFKPFVHARAKGKCEICGKYAPFILECHHIEPVAKGGHGSDDNLIALCPNCHAVVEKMRTSMADNPNFSDWLYEEYGEELAQKLMNLAYQRNNAN